MAREQVKRKPPAKGGAPAPLQGGVLMDKSGARVAGDPWAFLADEDAIPETGDIVVSQARFLAEREALLARNAGRLGVLVQPSKDEVEQIGADAPRFALIAVGFPAYRDGRGFTTARLLRERYAFIGELRAVGDVLPDLIFFMLRCGFDAFALKAHHPEEDFARAARTFSVAYQGAADGRLPAHRLRAKAKRP
jgi:uncharacterized protein (DUF934 family)